jgi:hypothetical protein
VRAAVAAAADDATDDGNEDEAADAADDSKDQGAILLEPAVEGLAFTLTLGEDASVKPNTFGVGFVVKEKTHVVAFTAVLARGAVEEVLVDTVARASCEGGAGAADRAAGVVTRLCVVAQHVRSTHDNLALLVAVRALS